MTANSPAFLRKRHERQEQRELRRVEGRSELAKFWEEREAAIQAEAEAVAKAEADHEELLFKRRLALVEAARPIINNNIGQPNVRVSPPAVNFNEARPPMRKFLETRRNEAGELIGAEIVEIPMPADDPKREGILARATHKLRKMFGG